MPRFVSTVWAFGRVTFLTIVTGTASSACHGQNWLNSVLRAFISRAASWLTLSWESCWESMICLAPSPLNWERLDSFSNFCRLIYSQASQRTCFQPCSSFCLCASHMCAISQSSPGWVDCKFNVRLSSCEIRSELTTTFADFIVVKTLTFVWPLPLPPLSLWLAWWLDDDHDDSDKILSDKCSSSLLFLFSSSWTWTWTKSFSLILTVPSNSSSLILTIPSSILIIPLISSNSIWLFLQLC